MFVVLYKWKVRPESEDDFVRAWTEITDYYLENADSRGSRLHKGQDGFWYAYAQWPTARHRDEAFSGDDLKDASETMRMAVLERLPEVVLEVVTDRLKHDESTVNG